MEEPYLIPSAEPDAPHESSLLIKRSRFLTHIVHAATQEAAKNFIDTMRTLHADATHNCWAFVAGPPGSTARIGASDDGEPHGTAGRPMLQILLHSNVGEICAVVTRWFGGIKLGTGGLVRAYQQSVSDALLTLPTVRRVALSNLLLTAGYADMERIQTILEGVEARVLDRQYGSDVRLTLALPESQLTEFSRRLAHVTDGRVTFQEKK